MDEVKAGKLRWWGLAWVGAISESAPGVGGNGRWVWRNGRDSDIEPEFFAENEMDDPRESLLEEVPPAPLFQGPALLLVRLPGLGKRWRGPASAPAGCR